MLGGLVLLLLAWSCGGGVSSIDLARLPAPSTEGLEPRVVEAIRGAEEAVRRDPGSAEAWRRLGVTYDAHLMAQPAEACYAASLELEPDDFWTRYQHAVSHTMLGSDARDSLMRFQALGAQGEALAQVHVRMGELHQQLGELEAARDRYDRAVELDPELALARRMRGQVLLLSGEPERALADLEAILSRGGATDRPTLAALAQAHGQLGHEALAREFAERSQTAGSTLILTDPMRSEATYLGVDSRTCFDRAQVRMGLGDFAGALEDLLIAEEHMPQQPYLQLRLASCYYELQQPALAVPRLERALAQRQLVAEGSDPQSPPDDLVALDAMISRFRMRYEQPPAELQPFVQRAGQLATAGDLGATLAEFARAEAATALTPRVRLAWARVAREHGRPQEALAQLEELLVLDPGNLQGHVLRGELLEELGNRAGALASYRRALRIDPRHEVGARVAALGG